MHSQLGQHLLHECFALLSQQRLFRLLGSRVNPHNALLNCLQVLNDHGILSQELFHQALVDVLRLVRVVSDGEQLGEQEGYFVLAYVHRVLKEADLAKTADGVVYEALPLLQFIVILSLR